MPVESYILVNNDEASTDDNDVILTIRKTDALGNHPETMRLTEDLSSWGAWEPYAETRTWKLSPQTSYPTQPKTVYVDFTQNHTPTGLIVITFGLGVAVTGHIDSVGFVNVKDYGDTGNGTTNDYAAIVSGITAANAAGKALYFPAGTYLMNSRLTVAAGTEMVGEGVTSWIKGPVTMGSNTTYTNLKVGAASYGTCIYGVSNITCDNVYFYGGGGLYSAGAQPNNCHTMTIGPSNTSGLHFTDCTFEPYMKMADSNDGSLHLNNLFIESNSGLSTGVRDITFTGCHFMEANRMQVEMWGNSGGVAFANFNNIHYYNCVFEKSGSELLDYAGPSSSTVSGCTFKGDGAKVPSSGYHSNSIVAEGGSGHLTITGNTFYRGRASAFSDSGAASGDGYNSFTNNTIDWTNNVVNTGITGNTSTSLSVGSTDNVITGNHIAFTNTTSSWAISLLSSSANCSVTGNVVTIKGTINNAGTGNTVSGNTLP